MFDICVELGTLGFAVVGTKTNPFPLNASHAVLLQAPLLNGMARDSAR